MLDRKFFGRSPVKKPQCPFCGIIIERPKVLSTRRQGEMPVGSCVCGAVYACDETGHNLGAAMIEALVFGCNMDWDLAWNLVAEEDYSQEIVENYDIKNHLLVSGGFFEGRRISGALYFIRLHNDVLEVTATGVKETLGKAIRSSTEASVRRSKDKVLTKKAVEDLVEKYQIDPLLDAAHEDKRIIRYLQRLLYSGDDVFRKRAAEILGKVCAIIGERDPEIVSRLLQNLFYSLTDTAAFSLGAIEAIGEIISSQPRMFGGYTPQLYQFVSDKTRKAQVVHALGKIAQLSPSLLRKHTLYFLDLLQDPDPFVRGHAAWFMGNLGAHEAEKDLRKLTHESHEIEMYENGNIVKKTVGQMALGALKTLSDREPVSQKYKN